MMTPNSNKTTLKHLSKGFSEIEQAQIENNDMGRDGDFGTILNLITELMYKMNNPFHASDESDSDDRE